MEVKEEENEMKKNDVLLLIFYIVLTVAMTGYVVKDKMEAKAGAIVVYSNGQEVKRISWPAENQTFEVENELGHITVDVKDGKVSVVDADCKDLVCVHTKSIDQGGEMIVCLPHKMYVEIKKTEKDDSGIDGFSQ